MYVHIIRRNIFIENNMEKEHYSFRWGRNCVDAILKK
jgi:hypothetical protein